MVKATKDNRPFSSGVFDLEEFNIYTKVIDLPLDGIPTYLEEGINGVCTGGSALFNVFSNKRRVVKNDLITIFPYQLASITEISTDFYNPQIQISAESETKRSIFREKDKTKRSKKESAQHSKSRNKSFVMTSVSAL